jgi:methylated-DNA-protein-cysteine methyltransferase related protein
VARVVGSCSQERQEAMAEVKKAAAKKAKGASKAATGEKNKREKYEQAFEKIYRIVLKIPRGRVMTYGQIARLLEERYSPRLVGWAMHATPQDERSIPWHRVINSKGAISTGRIIIQEPQLQQYLLEAEGVIFDARGHCDLSVYQWSLVARKKRPSLTAKSVLKKNGKAKQGAKLMKPANRKPAKKTKER